MPPFCKFARYRIPLFHWLRKFKTAFMTGQSLALLMQARYFVWLSWQRVQELNLPRRETNWTGDRCAFRFVWKCLSIWSSIQRAENMSEGAVPITEEIEELKKKLALLGKPWSTTFSGEVWGFRWFGPICWTVSLMATSWPNLASVQLSAFLGRFSKMMKDRNTLIKLMLYFKCKLT